PTTTRAANLKIRPPFTVLETRFRETTFSCSSNVLASIIRAIFYLPLKLESALAGALCEFFDAAVVEVAAAVEHHDADPLGFCALGHDLADLSGRFLVAAVRTKVLFGGGGRNKSDT